MIENVRRALSHLNIFFFFFSPVISLTRSHILSHTEPACVRARDLGDRQLAASPSPEKAWSSYQRSGVPLPSRQPAAHPRPVAADVLRGVGPWSPVPVRRPGGELLLASLLSSGKPFLKSPHSRVGGAARRACADCLSPH